MRDETKKILDENIDVVAHCVRVPVFVGHAESIIIEFEKPMEDVNSNTKSTLFMLEKIRKLKLSCKFILGSTFIVIGKPKKLPVNENTPCNPTTIYGTNRLASEHLCKIYHQVYDIDTNIFRITNSYGPRAVSYTHLTLPTKRIV